MSDELEKAENTPAGEPDQPTPQKRRSLFSLRNLIFLLGGLGVAALVCLIAVVLAFRLGFVDSYIESNLKERFSSFGIKAEIGGLKTTVFPTTAEIRDIHLADEKTGEELAKIDVLRLNLTISNVLALRDKRTIAVNSTDVEGLEVWVKFDENGRSNFSNLNFKVEEDPNLKVSFASMNFNLKDALIHYGDQSRKLSGTARNVTVLAEPENPAVPESERRYKFEFTSNKSALSYDEKPIEPIDVYAHGIADKTGADIAELKITSPLGETRLSGRLADWELLKYDLNITSNIDLMQAATLMPKGTVLHGTGNFEGKVTGQGEKYQIDGEVKSDSMAAANVIIKGLQVNAKADGENGIYTANGKAIAEMLTFEDFIIDYPQLVGNVRGSGSDFKWVGELRAAAARSDAGTLAGLFVADGVAEYKDKEFSANFGNARAREFTSADVQALDLIGRNIKVAYRNGAVTYDLPNLRAGTVKTDGAELDGVDAANIRGTSNGGKTSVEATSVRADNLWTKDAKVGGLTTGDVNITNQNGQTDIQAKNVRAETAEASGARSRDLNAGNLNISIRGNDTNVVSDGVRVAKVETDAAVLGDLNIAGVRFTVRQGRIEGTAGDVTAGDVTLAKTRTNPKGGHLENVKGFHPVFVVEPSGRYRASLDMSIGGGMVGSVKLGSARAEVVATNEQVDLKNLKAEVMDGNLNGDAVIAMSRTGKSGLKADFSNLDLAKILALRGGRVVPIAGKTTGNADLEFTGTDFKNASGPLTAEFTANAGTEERGLIPITGRLGLNAIRGVFNIDYANLNTEKSKLNAKRKFDPDETESHLGLELDSTDAREVQRLITALDLSPELTEWLNVFRVEFAGKMFFTKGKLTGDLDNPTIEGLISVDLIAMRDRALGSLKTYLNVLPATIALSGGVLQELGGGTAEFDAVIPRLAEQLKLFDNDQKGSIKATLTRINTGNLLAALPFDDLPDALRQIKAETSGDINITDMRNDNLTGSAVLSSPGGLIADQKFENMAARLNFAGWDVILDGSVSFAEGYLIAKGNYRRDTRMFATDVQGKAIKASVFRAFLAKEQDQQLPEFAGLVDVISSVSGEGRNFPTYNINFKGTGRGVEINKSLLGDISFDGETKNQLLTATLKANLEGQEQKITGTLNFADNLHLHAETDFNQTQLAPFIALLRPPEKVEIKGSATGRAFVDGNLYVTDANGKGHFTTDDIRGIAEFSEFGVQLNDTPYMAQDKISISFTMNEITVPRTVFAGGGSNVAVSGTKALSNRAINNLSLDGKINLRILDLTSRNTFYSGIADVGIRLTGPNSESRLSGAATVENGSISTFVGSSRLNFERIRGKVIFTSNQAQIENAVGYLGGGQVVGTGGAYVEGLKLQQFRLELHGKNVTAPLPRDYITTGDADVEITGKLIGNDYNTLISGNIRGKRSIYTRDIDLADVIGSRRTASLSEGTAAPALGIPKLDLTIEGRDALIVRNNIADLTGSVSLRVTGDVDYPIVSGRITANSGTVFFRNDKYDVRRGTLEFPPDPNADPIINLRAETDIKGYQVVVDLSGELNNLDALNAVVRSNPALPQSDVISLITTGNLSNTDTGIPSSASSSINTAAELITDSLINNPVRKATDKLFGLNKFEIDPILSGRRLTPGARLTVGRQINKNLAVTYSTNLSEDQNQVLALEYRVSNRLSFVAQYEQRSLNNVTRNNNNFSFEIRLRKRF